MSLRCTNENNFLEGLWICAETIYLEVITSGDSSQLILRNARYSIFRVGLGLLYANVLLILRRDNKTSTLKTERGSRRLNMHRIDG